MSGPEKAAGIVPDPAMVDQLLRCLAQADGIVEALRICFSTDEDQLSDTSARNALWAVETMLEDAQAAAKRLLGVDRV